MHVSSIRNNPNTDPHTFEASTSSARRSQPSPLSTTRCVLARRAKHRFAARLRSAATVGDGTQNLLCADLPAPAADYIEDWPPDLAGAAAGEWFRVDRVSDEDSAALQYLASLGVRPGVVLRVLEREPFGGPLWVEVGGQRRAMGTALTHLVHGVVKP